MLLNTYDEHVELQDFLKMIEKNCQPFLNLLDTVKDTKTWMGKQRPLFFRGMKKGGKVLIKEKVRKDRQAKDSSSYVKAEDLDVEFEKQLGIKARSQGVYTSSNSDTASRYGDVYMVFPIDSFDYITTTHGYTDMIDALQYYFEVIGGEEGEELKKEWLDKYGYSDTNYVTPKYLEKLVSDYHKNGDMKTAVKGGHEVVFICDEYYAIKDDSTYYQKILQWLDKR